MRYPLTGAWTLRDEHTQKECEGQLPGCNFLDLLHAGEIDDPFWGQNEERYKPLAAHDFTYSRSFDVPEDLLAQEHICLVLSGVDTLAVVVLNGRELARTDNCHRTYHLPVKEALRREGNHIAITLQSPMPYIKEKQARDHMVSANGNSGIGHLRKVQCHFGWDWGPRLTPAGVFGALYLEGYAARVDELRIRQAHSNGSVALHINAAIQGFLPGMELRGTLVHPGGKTQEFRLHHDQPTELAIQDPQLWWCNGLGAQPLYQLQVQLLQNDILLDSMDKTIGLRTIALCTDADEWGRRFQFVINGVPIFAKGANWIPTDSFVTRTTQDDLAFYIESAKNANMNMLRVWGGGMYESDAFYDLCDQNGILVWQDFTFACGSYPFYDADFLETVRCEVTDNVKRIRHHASLALWCGNNENEQLAILWRHRKKLYKANRDYYFDTLKGWVAALDGETPYWPGSPSSGKKGMSANRMDIGDTHLWQVWHGLMPIEEFRKMPTRFCSEFGVESFPSLRAVRSFTEQENPKITEPVMLAHQKSKGGNQKILFYLLAKYRNPANFADFAYLSQLVQANAIRFAVDEWRRRVRCSGALYWQFNDCWPVASWAGIDYSKQFKALHYHAKHFYQPICLSNDYFKDRAEIYLANDLPQALIGTLDWGFYDFSGKCIQQGSAPAAINALQSKRLLVLPYKEHLGSHPKEAAVLQVVLHVQGKTLDKKQWLLVPDKYAKLQPPQIKASAKVANGTAEITLQAASYSRYTYLELDCTAAPFSDNFFDIMGGGSQTVTVAVPESCGEADVLAQLHIKTLADAEPKHSMLRDRLRRFSMRFQTTNFITWLGYKFVR